MNLHHELFLISTGLDRVKIQPPASVVTIQHATLTERATIEVVGEDSMCFKVDAQTLEPLGGSYYEPAALTDPRGPQISYGEWCRLRNEQREKEMRSRPATGY